MSDLNDLQLIDDPIEVAEELPDQRQVRVPLLQPGAGIIFQLPDRFDYQAFQTDSGQRLMVKFYDTPLRTFPGGIQVPTSVSNMPQIRNKVVVNAWIYLLRALGFKGPLIYNKEYGAAMNQYPGDYFKADWEWTMKCNPKKDAYVQGKGRVPGRSGCGQTYGQRARSYTNRDGKPVEILQIPRESDGSFKESVLCKCGATLFANGELSNFQSVPREAEKVVG